MKRFIGFLLMILFTVTAFCGCNSAKVNSEINSEDKIVTSTITTVIDDESTSKSEIDEEIHKIVKESDKIGDLDIQTVKKIKTDYVNSNEELKKYHYTSVVINQNYGTLSDGSLLLDICVPTSYQMWITYDISFHIVENYAYFLEGENFLNKNLMLYKNSKFYLIKDAYENNIITKKALDEIFTKNPELNICNQYVNKKDTADNLTLEETINIKYLHNRLIGVFHNESFGYYSKKYGLPEVNEFYTQKCNINLKNGYRCVNVKQEEPKEDVSEKIGNYTYTHNVGDKFYVLKVENDGEIGFYSLSLAYSYGLISDNELEEILKYFT